MTPTPHLTRPLPRTVVRDLPAATYGPDCTNVLLACLHDPFPTYGSIMDLTGLSRSQVRRHLDRLRRDDLITYQPGLQGTIRPLLAPIRARLADEPIHHERSLCD